MRLKITPLQVYLQVLLVVFYFFLRTYLLSYLKTWDDFHCITFERLHNQKIRTQNDKFETSSCLAPRKSTSAASAFLKTLWFAALNFWRKSQGQFSRFFIWDTSPPIDWAPSSKEQSYKGSMVASLNYSILEILEKIRQAAFMIICRT